MWTRNLCTLCVLAVLVSLCGAGKPLGGKYKGAGRGVHLTLAHNASSEGKTSHNHTCRGLTLYNKADIHLVMKGHIVDGKDNYNVTTTVTIFKSECSNFVYSDCAPVSEVGSLTYVSTFASFKFVKVIEHDQKHEFYLLVRREEGSANSSSTGTELKNTTKSMTNTVSTTVPMATPMLPPSTDPTVLTDPPQIPVINDMFRTNSSGLYVVHIASEVTVKKDKKILEMDLTFDLEMKNPHGFLSAIDYPALVFYSVMVPVYGVMGVVWVVAMCCSYKDLVRLQFWIFAVIILGFLEKIFFVSEYGSVNTGEESSFLFLLVEAISAIKRGLARVLLIIVSLGYGTVIPKLGDSSRKLAAVFIIYTLLAFIDSVLRENVETTNIQDTSQFVTMALLFIMNTIIFTWMYRSLQRVRRALRQMKDYVKLSMYNHFSYALIFAVVVAVVFTAWLFIDVNFPKNGCLEDWQGVWLKDCFWHFLFCFILIVIMIIWRPSANNNRFAYSLVNDLDQDADEEEENKNVEMEEMKMVAQADGTPPPVSSSQAEDDKQSVEENIPTSAMDKALPLISDSDDKVMHTNLTASEVNSH